MIALKITGLGSFMSRLFSGNTFDSFLLSEGSLQTAITWQFDGKINENFYEKEYRENPSLCPYDYAAWSQVRPFLRDLIRGKRVPVSFHFILHLKPEIMQAMLEKEGDNELISCVGAFVLTIRYKNGEASLLTGISMKSFTMNKNADRLWDKTIRRFLEANEIAFELPG
jgi:hypothetical protein